MIRRTLSPRPDTCIVRLPYVVGQARLVGVPDLSQCCIYDTFTDAPYIFLGDHKPELGGPWDAYGSAQPIGGGSYHNLWPQILGGMAWFGKGEGLTWAHARIDCASDVRIRATFRMHDQSTTVISAAVAMRWDGNIQTNSAGGLYVYLNRGAAGIVAFWLVGGTVTDAGNAAFLGSVPYIASNFPDIELEVMLMGRSLTWDAKNCDSGESATKNRAQVTVKSDYDGLTGVGFHMNGSGVYGLYTKEFRACPL